VGNFLKALPLGLGLPIVLFVASVGPEDAASNISKWVRAIGIHDPPAWLITKSADRDAIIIAIIIAIMYAGAVWVLVPLIRHAGKRKPALAWQRYEPAIGTSAGVTLSALTAKACAAQPQSDLKKPEGEDGDTKHIGDFEEKTNEMRRQNERARQEKEARDIEFSRQMERAAASLIRRWTAPNLAKDEAPKKPT
jgi:hypothetical protein